MRASAKLKNLSSYYELAKIKLEKSITEMFAIFENIINGLNALDKSYTNSYLLRKISGAYQRVGKQK